MSNWVAFGMSLLLLIWFALSLSDFSTAFYRAGKRWGWFRDDV